MGLQNFLDNRQIKRFEKEAGKILDHQRLLEDLSDEDMVTYTEKYKEEYKQTGNEEDIRIKAFALAREAAKRVLGIEAYLVQLIGGLVLSEGDTAEMKTGEGKTLVSLFPIYFEAIKGVKTHLITANEYLAERDRNEIGRVLEYLGVSVGMNVSGMSSEEKKAVYKKDVIYGIASEFGFDYLRDNMAKTKEHQVQTGLEFVLIDEADSILIDEARTPLIISGKKQEELGLYEKAKFIINTFTKEDYEYNLENNSVWLTEKGIERIEKFWKVDELYSLENKEILRITSLVMKAFYTMKKDRDYVVKDGEILIVDQNTGRIMDGRRFSDGLHQAIEAKENVEIKDETITLATVTIQNYFRMYKKIAGMTGTAKTEEEELRKIYGMDVLVIPTNKPIARVDDRDEIYINKLEKAKAIVREVKERNLKGQPVLVGTSSIEENEWLSDIFTKEKIEHRVLNAKQHQKEAEIIVKAGEKGAVTIATNMAGRGTDIKLTEETRELGGLAVIGTEKSESRRVENQLKGRSGRQGDPGYSKFILSLEDELIRRFNGDKIKTLAEKMNFPEEEAIKHKVVFKAIETAQKRLEGANFDIRKNILEYDEVMDIQRKFIYSERNKIMDLGSTLDVSLDMLQEYITEEFGMKYNEIEPENFLDEITNELKIEIEPQRIKLLSPEEAKEEIIQGILNTYKEKRKQLGEDLIDQVEKTMFLNLMDQFWVSHLGQLVGLKEGIHLRSYAQKNPLTDYQSEAAEMFQELIYDIKKYYCSNILNLQVSHIAAG